MSEPARTGRRAPRPGCRVVRAAGRLGGRSTRPPTTTAGTSCSSTRTSTCGWPPAAGNAALADQLRIVNERIRVVRMHDFLTAERVRTTIAQHLAVLDALLRRPRRRAEARLVQNFSESLAVVEDRAALAIARMVPGRGVAHPG